MAAPSTYKTTRSGSPVAFWLSAVCRWLAKTATLIKFFAQLKVSINRSSVDGVDGAMSTLPGASA